ncbi:hypothetical protein TSAR_004065 [Trichomalopsis sarcophagae]|uniref:RNase H type-1 domain-containing protein n=1 Tax=Trichomalopsis sarcophagae TaxID=543379 RepID=A0A232EY70_9HYME|nr:hypothetical protein TSAR_004065 [Trichomalopsis sarcophagae]
MIKKFNLPLPYPFDPKIILTEEDENIISEQEGRIIQKAKIPNEKFNEIFKKQPIQIIDFYTDGSKSEDSEYTGAALFSPNINLEKKFKFTKLASIFTAEAYAIMQTLIIIKNDDIPKTRIFTDSKSVLQAITNYSPLKSKNTSYLILEIKKLIYEIKEKNLKTKIYWIPAHKDILNNEIVDKLAKEATKTGDQINLKLPYTDLFEEIKKAEHKSFRKKLDSQKNIKGVQYFQNYYEESSKPWFYNSIVQRYHITTINRIRANHYSLAESLYRKNLVNSEACKCGFISEDIEHVITECPLYNKERTTLIKKLKKNKSTFPINLIHIFKNPNSKEAKFITEFLKTCKLSV